MNISLPLTLNRNVLPVPVVKNIQNKIFIRVQVIDNKKKKKTNLLQQVPPPDRWYENQFLLTFEK